MFTDIALAATGIAAEKRAAVVYLDYDAMLRVEMVDVVLQERS